MLSARPHLVPPIGLELSSLWTPDRLRSTGRKAGDGAFRQRLTNTLLHRGDELAGDRPADDFIDELESAAAKIPVQGARYPEELERMVGR